MLDPASDYGEYYRQNLKDSEAFEDVIYKRMKVRYGWHIKPYRTKREQCEKGENDHGLEIKFDKRLNGLDGQPPTGNLAVECEEKARPRPGPYYPSGIYRDDNSFLYAVGDRDECYVFAKRWLQLLDKSDKFDRYEIPTSGGFLLPREKAKKCCLFILTPDDDPCVCTHDLDPTDCKVCNGYVKRLLAKDTNTFNGKRTCTWHRKRV